MSDPWGVIGLERVNAGAAAALVAFGYAVVDAQAPIERARAVKGPDESLCIAESLRSTERAVHALRNHLRPSATGQAVA